MNTVSPARTGYAEVDGARLYYEIHGAGDPIVLLHGGVLTIELSFATLLPALATGRQVIAVELRGHGRSTDTDREFSIPDFAAGVVGVLDHLGIEQADFFGFSLGGLTALQVAIADPRRVGRLILGSTHYRPDGYYPEISDPAMTSPRLPTPEDFAAMREAYVAVAPDPDHFEAFMAKVGPAVHAFPGWTDDQLRALTAPTLLVIGDFDFVRPEHALRMQELIPDVQLAILPGTKHNDVTHRPEVVPMIERFLG
ncbi:MAG TPA: alpha/beta hydrolase [Mycobacteriales bacterium]|nr:alpha/beta hydrolase [Mycobacteriales bacterium]